MGHFLVVAALGTYSTNLRDWWNKADETYSHIRYDRWLTSPDALIRMWNRSWLHRLPSDPGHVVEYGIGAGLLGKVLLESYNASFYTGLDISDRQLSRAWKTLSMCCKSRYRLERVVDKLILEQIQGAQTFVSQAVIQHFPSVSYVVDFLAVLNAPSTIRWMMLQVREIPSTRVGTSVTYASSVTRAQLETYLSSFRILWQSKRHTNGYVFYIFERTPTSLVFT